MTILALDTSFGACSVALLRADGVRFSAYAEMPRGHAEALMPMVAEIVDASGVAFRDIRRIAATIGPGSFTGIRIAVAAARGLALATGAELFGATSLAVMARGARDRGVGVSGPLAVARDARRGAIYLGVYLGDGTVRTEACLVSPEEAIAGLSGARMAVGDGAQALAAAVRTAGRTIEALLPGLQPEAASLAALAAEAAAAHTTLRPLYFRPADARPQSAPIPRSP